MAGGSVEHDGEVFGFAQGKANVGESGVFQPIEHVGLLRSRSHHSDVQFLVSLSGDRGDHIRFISEVPIGRVVRNPGATSDLP